MEPRTRIIIRWVLILTSSTLASEFYSVYDGLFNCNSLGCADGWQGSAGIQQISTKCTDPPLYLITLDSTSTAKRSIRFETQDLNVKLEHNGKVWRMVGYVALDIYFIGAWNNGLVRLTWRDVVYNI